jgi:hypothetical protein
MNSAFIYTGFCFCLFFNKHFFMIKNLFKIIFISIFLLLSNNAFWYSGDFIYNNLNDDQKLYIKNTDVSWYGTSLNTRCFQPFFSLDNLYIICNHESNWFLRKIEIANPANYTEINSVSSYGGDLSSDWNFIIYKNSVDWLIYKKNANDSSNWSAINTISVDNNNIIYSNDWLYIYYIVSWDIYIKNANDSSNWTVIYNDVINAVESFWLSSDDNFFIISKNNYLYKIEINNISNITQLTDIASYWVIISSDWNIFFYSYISSIELRQRLYSISWIDNWLSYSIQWFFPTFPNDSLDPIWCYNIKTWYSFTWITYEKLFNGENIDDYNISHWSTWYIYNYLIFENTINNNKFSYVFTATDKENLDPVNYYLNDVLCEDINCIKLSLFDSWSTSYIQILNQNLFTSNNQNILFFNSNLNNINSFWLQMFTNQNYTLYWRKNNSSIYEEIWYLESYNIDWLWWINWEDRSLSWATYSDFKIILPYNSLWFSSYMKNIIIWYWWSYQTSYSEVCNYEDWTITLDWKLTNSGAINEIIWSVPVEKNFEDVAVQSIWDLDIDKDWNISVFEYWIAPITIAKNIIIKLYGSLKNIWNFLKEIMEIWNISFIYTTHAETWILHNITNLTLWVYNWEKTEVSEITWIINMTKYWFMFSVFFVILFFFFYFRFYKN